MTGATLYVVEFFSFFLASKRPTEAQAVEFALVPLLSLAHLRVDRSVRRTQRKA